MEYGWNKALSEPIIYVIIIYLSKLTNQVLIVLVQYHNRLWVQYFDCSRGYLQFDMLVAIVSDRGNETCSF